jgi:hypothetical protein
LQIFPWQFLCLNHWPGIATGHCPGQETISAPLRRSQRIAARIERLQQLKEAPEPPNANQAPARPPEDAVNQPLPAPPINPPMGDAAAPAAAAVDAVVGAAAGAGAATTFALTPAAAHSDVLDYTRREHTKIYDAAMAPLEGDKFDGTPENLANFLARLREKANNFMWMDSICKIKVLDEPPATFRNLIDDYGNIKKP